MSRDPNALSPVQQKILDFVHQYDQENGRPPTMRDIAKFRKCAVNAAYIQIKTIEKKGKLKRMNGRIVVPRGERPIVPVSNPDGTALGHYDQVRKIIHATIDKHIDDAMLKGKSVTFNQVNGERLLAPTEDGFENRELNGTHLLTIDVGPYHTDA